ncbi:FAD-dependent oxidoreductase [Halocatena marina]|uniref:CoB--CoM heterodisulfide reductase iron-sulfur subunit A n=1 Tax=Halocatena marina TaxID=2934937 RepID=A0ABD5YSA7_9EURY|nr:FAD-dependent oxidoreductase [Halocatena marina]
MTRTHSAVVLGGTPGGIASAIRAAREGHDTLLLTYNQHLGGMMTGGLSYTDTMMKKPRAPLFTEFRAEVREHYRSEFGVESSDYDACEDGYISEPHVAETIFEALIEGESNLEVRRGYYPTHVERNGRTIKSLTVSSFDDDETLTVEAPVFIEATYEGDLLATAGVSYRLGRESRSEYNEQFAGELYTRTRGDRYYPQEAIGEGVDSTASDKRRGPLDTPTEQQQGKLDLIPHPAGISELYPKSTGVGDNRIQAYSYRLCLTNNPSKRVMPSQPEVYDPDDFQDSLEEVKRVGLRAFLRLRHLPNDKADMNTADLPGENYEYPEGDWETRDEIAARHRSHVLGLLYFLQHDDAVPDDIQAEANEWGLAADEFVDNNYFPFQLYIREARRLDGRYTFTENDARYAPNLDRPPIHHDSIAVAEYPLDSHACKPERQAGSHPEGHFFASQVTRPAHVPYRTVLPKEVDNLLVTVPLSASHVGYGSLRLEPTWLHIGESVGFAAAIALNTGTAPAKISVNQLQQTLAGNEVMLSFFNDHDVTDEEAWAPALQYLGTRGFFESFDAKPTEPLTKNIAAEWARTTVALLVDELDDPTRRARALADLSDSAPVTSGEFANQLESMVDYACTSADVQRVRAEFEFDQDTPLLRGEACRFIYRLLSGS